MSKSRSKLYSLILIACFAGYFWLAFSYYNSGNSVSYEPGICLMKEITGIPCPSCGSTREIISIIHGDAGEFFHWNPLGLVTLFIMITVPFWILYDVMMRKESMFIFYKKNELILRRKWISIPLIMLVIINWIWNIYKGL
jgi:hypothetical protein